VAGNYYYKGNIIVPAVAYRNGGVNYFMRVDLHDGTHKYVGLNGGVMVDSDDPIGLTPFSTTFNPRPMATVTSTGGVVALADGGPAGSATRVTFPDGAVSGNSAVYIEQLDPADTARVPRPNGMSAPVAAYDFDGSVRRFNKPIELTLRYLDVTGGPNGTPDGVVDGTTIDAGTLRVFWWDGFVWRLVGGEVDLVHHAVTAKTAHFSVYALFPTTGAPPAAAAYRPLEKVFTPNGDGKNDSVKFSGLLSTTGFEIRIFDATGRRVRTINDIDVWDGKDDNGKTVENGAYVYQFRADNSSDWISGMIGVAK
jgi:gliding motility-associated-like protein